MALTGYRNSCGKQSGGIKHIALAEAAAVREAIFDDESDTFGSVLLAEGYAFAVYHFREGGAYYAETVSCRGGSYLVEHRLSFALGRLDGNSVRAAEEIAEASKDGMIAIVTTGSGISLLVGYSEEFGTENPLRLSGNTGTTGRKSSDATSEIITLSNRDCSKSKVYTGEILCG